METGKPQAKKSRWKSMDSLDMWSLKTIESCKQVCKTAFYASLWSGLLSPIFLYIVGSGALGTEIQLQLGGFDWTVLVQSAIFIIAGYYTMKGSRVAAVILFLLFAAGKVSMMTSMGSQGNIGVFWWLIYGYTVVATFQWYKLEKYQSNGGSNSHQTDSLELTNEQKSKTLYWVFIAVGVMILLAVWSQLWERYDFSVSSKDSTIINSANEQKPKLLDDPQVDSGNSFIDENNNYISYWDNWDKKIEYMTTGSIEQELLIMSNRSDVMQNEAKLKLAEFYTNQGRYEQSNRILGEMSDKKDFNVSNSTTFIYFKCLNYYQLGNYQSAKLECDKLSFMSINSTAQYLVIDVEHHLNNYDKALELSNQGISMYPSDPSLWFSRASIRMNKVPQSEKDNDNIIYDSNKAIELRKSGDDNILLRSYILRGYSQLLKDQKTEGCDSIRSDYHITPIYLIDQIIKR